MWQALPRLYWRVKIGDEWKYVPAHFEELDRYQFEEDLRTSVSNIVRLHWPPFPEGEEGESDESV